MDILELLENLTVEPHQQAIIDAAVDEIERLREKIKWMEYYLPENIDFVRCGNGKDHFSFEIVYKALSEKE